VTPGFTRPSPKKRGCLSVLLVLGALTLAFVFCCCFGGLMLLGLASDENSPTPLSRITDPLAVGDATAIATVLVPETAPVDAAFQYTFPLDWKKYALAYGIDETVRRDVEQSEAAVGQRLSFVKGDNGNFRWTPSGPCQPEPWECVYRAEAKDNRQYIKPIARAFAEYQQAHSLDARTTIELVFSWVQHITYRLPEDEPFGVLPATRVAAEGWGDCDSKTLLAALVLDELGVETVVLHSEKLKHAALGVALPGSGPSWTWRGQRFQYVELTSPGWAVGTLPPEVNVPSLWRVIDWH
jgi:hypothetical protein